MKVNEEIPQWAFKRVHELMDAEYGKGCWFTPGDRKAFARYIAQHEQPPVDPDLVKAREICARVAEEYEDYKNARLYRDGIHDNSPEVKFVLSALQEARNG